MDLDKLTESIDKLVRKLKESESQVDYLKQRESKLLASNKVLQEQMDDAQTKVHQIISKLKSVEEPA